MSSYEYIMLMQTARLEGTEESKYTFTSKYKINVYCFNFSIHVKVLHKSCSARLEQELGL